MEEQAIQYIKTPIGWILLRAEGGALLEAALTAQAGEEHPNAVTRTAARQLEEYFRKNRQKFTIELAPRGTPFQRRVWDALAKVPYGTTVTYGQLAAAIDRPNACRATANAVGKNPLLIFLPCHRVVAAKGIGGFSSGLPVKRILLHTEEIDIE